MLKSSIAIFSLVFSALFANPAQPEKISEPESKESEIKEQVIERTLSIIKPDAVENNQIGDIEEYFENAGLKIIAAKMTHLTENQAKDFYAIHKDKAFYNDLVAYMTSGPVLVQILEGEDAVAVNRQVMGATDPHKASPGTIRADFGSDIQHNAVHGSDSPENAEKEIAFFFKSDEIFSKN